MSGSCKNPRRAEDIWVWWHGVVLYEIRARVARLEKARACLNREMAEYLRRLSMVFEADVFEEMYAELYGLTNVKGKAFLKEYLLQKAFDHKHLMRMGFGMVT